MQTAHRFVGILAGALVLCSTSAPQVAAAQPPAPTRVQPVAKEPARQLLLKALSRYQTLSTFSMSLQHQDSSGLFPGAYAQKLNWRRGGKFTLLVTTPAPGAEVRHAPNYYADGKQVVLDFSEDRFINNIVPSPNTTPGWEVSGGLIVSTLQKTQLFDLIRGKEVFPATFAFGPRTMWHGKAVREIIARPTGAAAVGSSPMSFFVEPEGQIYYGNEWVQPDKKVCYAFYTDQKFNPTLSTTLGQAPAAGKRHVVDEKKQVKSPAYVPPETLAAGTDAPDFTIEDTAGKPVKLSDFRGKVVVLDFWATWCGPCIASMPHTNNVAGQFKNDVVVLAVNTSDKKEAFTKWLGTNQSRYANLTFAIDTSPKTNIARSLYKVTGIPTQYVINRDGKIVVGMVGYGGETPALHDAIQKALIGSAPGMAQSDTKADAKK